MRAERRPQRAGEERVGAWSVVGEADVECVIAGCRGVRALDRLAAAGVTAPPTLRPADPTAETPRVSAAGDRAAGAADAARGGVLEAGAPGRGSSSAGRSSGRQPERPTRADEHPATEDVVARSADRRADAERQCLADERCAAARGELSG